MKSALQDSPTILVVDDEPMIRSLIVEFLTRKNIRTLEASTGQEALQIVDREDQYPDIIVTDLLMPDMDGLQLLSQLRQSVPTLKALMISGFYEDTVALAHVLDEKTRFLQKPFNFRMLERSLRALHPTLPVESTTNTVAVPPEPRRGFRRKPVLRTRQSS